MVELGGQTFEFVRGSDVDRDGFYVEAISPNAPAGECVAELFYSDKDGGITFTAFQPNLPIELIEYMVTEGRKSIVPVKG